MSINRVVLVGRLTKDPELRHTANMEVCRFTVACDRSKGEQADFISCVAFKQSATYLSQYGTKGALVMVDGRIQTGSYEKDGRKIYTTDVIAERVELVRENRSTSERKPMGTSTTYTKDIADSVTDIDIIPDDDLPF